MKYNGILFLPVHNHFKGHILPIFSTRDPYQTLGWDCVLS